MRYVTCFQLQNAIGWRLQNLNGSRQAKPHACKHKLEKVNSGPTEPFLFCGSKLSP